MEFMKEPPMKERFIYDWPKIVGELKSHPGLWAIVEHPEGVAATRGSAGSVSRRIIMGDAPGVVKGEYEATIRGTTVYARYVGNKASV